MANSAEIVEKAAAFLDTYGPANWRSKVNVDVLDMGSLRHCVLGQIYGNYDRGYDKLSGYSGWNATAFCDHQAAWINYLSSGKVDKYKGVEWVGKSNGVLVTAIKSFEIEGTLFVAYKGVSSARPLVRLVSDFLADYKPKPEAPKYVVGQLYTDKDKRYVFLYHGEDVYPNFNRLNGDGGTKFASPGHADVSFYERECGPLVPLALTSGKFDRKTVHAVIK